MMQNVRWRGGRGEVGPRGQEFRRHSVSGKTGDAHCPSAYKLAYVRKRSHIVAVVKKIGQIRDFDIGMLQCKLANVER